MGSSGNHQFDGSSHEPVVLTLEIVVLSPELAEPPEPRPQDRGEDDHADEHDKKELGSDLGHEDDLQRSQPVREQRRSFHTGYRGVSFPR